MRSSSRLLAHALPSVLATLIVLSSTRASLASLVLVIVIYTFFAAAGVLIILSLSSQKSPMQPIDFDVLKISSFVVGGGFLAVTWQLSIALGFSGLVLVCSVVAFLFVIFIVRRSKSGNRGTDSSIEKETMFSETITVANLSLLLFIATVPLLQILFLPYAIVSAGASMSTRWRRSAQVSVLVIAILVVRGMLAENNLLVVSDDSIWADGSSSVFARLGYWSWFGASNIYSPHHWLAYGMSGWFTNATENQIFFGVTIAFPAVMCVTCAAIVSLLRVGNDPRKFFTFQVLLILIGFRLIGSQSISADLGFVAVSSLAFHLSSISRLSAAPYLLLFIIPFAKIQFVPIVCALTIGALFLRRDLDRTSSRLIRFAFQIGVLTFATTLALNRLPVASVFGWNTNSEWGASLIQIRVSDLLYIYNWPDLIELLSRVFAPSLILLSIGFWRSKNRIRSEVLVSAFVTATTLILNLLLDFANVGYYGWITLAITIMYGRSVFSGLFSLSICSRLGANAIGVTVVGIMYFVFVSSQRFDVWSAYVALLQIALVGVGFSWMLRLWRSRKHSSVLIWCSTSLTSGYVMVLCLPALIITLSPLMDVGWNLRSLKNTQVTLTDLGFSNQILQAGQWIRKHSDADDVIATNLLCELNSACNLDGRPLVIAATHRRTFIEAERFAFGASSSPLALGNRYPGWIHQRLSASIGCASYADAHDCDILRANGVTLMMIDQTRIQVDGQFPVCATFFPIRVVSISKAELSNSTCLEKD